MALTYQSPGVNVSETVGTNIAPTLASPTTLCLVGLGAGAVSGVDQVTLQDGDADNNPVTPVAPVPITLPGVPTDATLNSVTEVRDSFSGVKYVQGTDYTVQANARTITRIATGSIVDGTVVRVSYSHTPSDYFVAKRYTNLQEIESRFGPVWTKDGLSVGTPLSHAAQIAFDNGAPFLVIQPLFVLSGLIRSQPTPSQAGSAATWQTTIQALREFEDINIITPVVGAADVTDPALDISVSTILSIFNVVQDHIWFMRTQDQYVLGVLGEDSSQGVSLTSNTRINHAVSLQSRYDGDMSENLVLVSASKMIRGAAAPNQTLYVGGQYVAAALAGSLAGSRVQTSRTRKALSGFLQVAETLTKDQKNAEANNGICVIEQRGEQIQVRHGVTLDTRSAARREISVVRAKHFMVETLYNTFENKIIGTVFADDDAPVAVRSAVIATLARLQSLEVIARFRDVDARLLNGDPTTVEVRFSYQPLFPLNYINIVFSLDFASGTITNVLPGAGR